MGTIWEVIVVDTIEGAWKLPDKYAYEHVQIFTGLGLPTFSEPYLIPTPKFESLLFLNVYLKKKFLFEK